MRRPAILSLHRWLGLILAPFLLVQAFTGSVLVLHELFASPAPAASRSAPLSTLIARAEAAEPGYAVRRVYLPAGPGLTAFAELQGPAGASAYAELDGASGEILRKGALWRFPYRAAVQVHYRLASGTPGMVLVLLTGLMLALATLSGLVHWWPGRGRVIAALKVRPKLPPRLRLRQWHRTVGAIGALLALFSATTGVLLIAPDLSAGAPPAPALARTPARLPSAIDAAMAAARARFPGAVPRDVRLPPDGRLDVNFHAPGRNPRATHTVSVALDGARVIRAIPAARNPVLWMKVLPQHTGESFGAPGPLALLAEAGALLFLSVAGPLMWLQARKRKAR